MADTSTINLAILTVDIFLNNKLNKGSNVSTYFAKNALKISANNQPINYKTQKVVSDISGQLAYTYGTATAGSKVSNYLRIWRKIKPKSWLVVYEMVN